VLAEVQQDNYADINKGDIVHVMKYHKRLVKPALLYTLCTASGIVQLLPSRVHNKYSRNILHLQKYGISRMPTYQKVMCVKSPEICFNESLNFWQRWHTLPDFAMVELKSNYTSSSADAPMIALPTSVLDPARFASI
jgi:hypothetical protein